MSTQPRLPAPLERQHPHPRPAEAELDVLVVGGGHAGVEAALAARRMGARTAIVSLRRDLFGEMSCNPAIGGLGKGQIVKEIDALGGLMGLAADASGLQFRMLNTRKGAAVRAPRCQSDRHLYREVVTAAVEDCAGLQIVEGEVAALLVGAGPAGHGRWVRGVRLASGRELEARAVILCTGTFLRSVMHMGEQRWEGGRAGESSSVALAADLARFDLTLGRLKTGTPPRLVAGSIDFSALEAQHGDAQPRPFSWATERERFPALEPLPCHVTYTSPAAHEIIRANLHRAPLYTGAIEGVGPRYCPSVEDKVTRFADRDKHQIFLEPESRSSDWIYANGISTSLPKDVQEAFIRTIEGLQNVRFQRYGYAVEYDFVQPSQLDDTLALREVPGLYLAGQINGTSGYEEAAAQGLMAGANAALWTAGRSAFVLARHEAYIGVMIDDLVVTQPTEPYRMFTSRAEYRLLLRQDTADARLVERAQAVGLVGQRQWADFRARRARLRAARELCDATRWGGKAWSEWLRRPEVLLANSPALAELLRPLGLDDQELERVETDIKYEGYVSNQIEDVERARRREGTSIPADFNYEALHGLALEARQKMADLRPRTLGAAGRIAGVRPPDVALLSVFLERSRRSD